MSMMYDVSFCNLHEDTVGEAYLSSKQGTRSSIPLSVLVSSFSKRKGQRRAVTSTRSGSRHGLARRVQRSEEDFQEKTENLRQQLDLQPSKWENCVTSHAIKAVRRRRSMCRTAGHSLDIFSDMERTNTKIFSV